MKRHQNLHLKAPDNWVNDPNGFIYYKGYYHLFYQYFPYGPRWGTMHWGHAVSKDLVSWEHKDLALFPTIKEDQNGCFSGSAIEEDGKLYLVYTGVRYEEINPHDPHTCLNDQFESAQLMIASDDGFHFDNQRHKEVIIPPVTDPLLGDRTHTRDPKIWRGKDAWYIILGSTIRRDHGEVLFYRSEDLHTWHYMNRAEKNSDYGWMWECPDYFETSGGKVLLISAMHLLKNNEKEKNHSICFTVDYDEDTCTIQIPDTYQYLDYGLDLYAPQTTVDKEGRRVLSAWIRMPKVTKEGWIGMFCSPRVVEVENNHIFFRMHPNIRDAYRKDISDVAEASEDGYMAEFDLKDGEYAEIGGFRLWREGDCLITDRTNVFPDFEGAHLISGTPELQEGCHLEILVDPNLIEIYINNGEYVLSNIVYDLKNTFHSNASSEIRFSTTE